MTNWFEDAWEREEEEIEAQRKQEMLWCEREIDQEENKGVDDDES